MAKATIVMQLTAQTPPAAPCTGDVQCSTPARLNNTNIPHNPNTVADEEYDAVLAFMVDIAASGTVVLDFLDVAREDPIGVQFDPIDILAFHLKCAPNSTTSELGDLRVEQNTASDPWVGWLSTTGVSNDAGFALKQGMQVLVAGLAAGDMPVTAGSSKLLISETTTTLGASFQGLFVGRRGP